MRKSAGAICGILSLFFIFMGLFANEANAAEVDWVRVGTSGRTIIILLKDPGGAVNLSDLLSDRCVSVRGWAIHNWIDHVNADAATQPAK